MRITSITVYAWGEGNIQVSLDNSTVMLSLTKEESEQLLQRASEIFTSRQKSIAREIEMAGPVLLEHVPERIPVDDISF